MVSLAELKVDGVPPSASVLALFTGDAPQDGELTPADRAFLRTLYSVRLDRPAREQRSAMKGRMVSYMLDPDRR